jgi:hypothetical protein
VDMRRKIPYAGYDPDEDDYSMLLDELPPSLAWQRCGYWRRRSYKIDHRRAAELRVTGMTWKQVALQMTHEAGRAIAYKTDSVFGAVHRARQQKEELT